ncbi:C-C motif chemokine 27a [Hypanus sabinus]|uniref:C-C motif chemokine 27a n=1 Tax=Hypanus sabinus TaxID=79690 RepID=UPI0028C47BE2|nr:C-C motif chemokine 27a [Hypanus sabinus]
MNHKMIALLIGVALLCAATVAQNSHSISCCTEVSNNVKRGLLKLVKCFEIQETQMCNIKAVILHMTSKKICIDPKNPMLKKWTQKHQSKKQCKARS